MAYAALSDMFTMTIPNRVSLILIAAFAGLALATGMAGSVMAMHGAAAALVFLVCFGLFAAGVMGGGDAKLLTAASLWFGLSADLLSFLLTTSVLGGLLTILILSLRTDRVQYLATRFDFTHRIATQQKGIPYGIAIGIAGLLSYPETPMMQQLITDLAAR